MADNVTLPGTGVVIRSKDTGGGIQDQYVILSDPTSAAGVMTSLVNGLQSLAVLIANEVACKGELLEGDLSTGFRPMKFGGEVGAGIAQRTLQSDAHMVAAKFTGDGRLLVLENGPPEDQLVTTPVALASDTASHTLIGAQAAGVKIALWGISLFNPSATATSIKIIDQTGSPVTLAEIPVPALPGIPHLRFTSPLRGTIATQMNYQLTASLGGGSITPFGYKTAE